jgi:hypothetical protein
MERSVAAAAQANPSQCYCVSVSDLMNFMLWALPILLMVFMIAAELSKELIKELGLDKI